MSASPMLDLIAARDGAIRPKLPEARSLVAWHAALTAEIAAHLTPAHAALLALPARTPTGWAWRAAGEDQRGFTDLAAADRRALTTAIGVILSDIRRLGESGRAPAVAACWPALAEVPDWKYVFAVDGRPVLAGWGHGSTDGSAGLLARFDDGVRWRPPPSVPWPVYAAALGVVALLALAAGLLLPVLGGALLAPPQACMAAPGQRDLLAEQNRAATRGDELKQLLAVLAEEIGRRQLQCPIRSAPPPPLPAPRPQPQPHADLPQDRWDQHDLAMLEGCWRSTTPMSTQEEATGRVRQVTRWRLCFDRAGHGRQSISWSDSRSRQGSMRAAFADNSKLKLTDTERCNGTGVVLRMGRFECERISDNEANCTRTDVEGPAAGGQQYGRFMR